MPDDKSLLQLTADIVSAYVMNNPIPAGSLPDLIADINTSIRSLGGPIPLPEPVELVPAVPIKKSITPDYLVSLEDGRKFKSLKRHLMAHYGLTPEQYRKKWSLPADYPMVAPGYAARRSELAKGMGLGRAPKAAAVVAAAPAKRGRKPSAAS
ncbi:MucR family transcriptional regulator [Mesorhizobium sp. ASY16-5R]|uniref:MucR family transcriptional regulator n=1 Tax=Mesorhizobium sp. ASY16-5R TaxID=3445772 RepID=UPI003FA07C07